jgi:hypothetical protein
MVVASGTDGHVHSFWELHQPVAAALLPDVNRRLARELGGDLASVDATRILRPPLSLNHKHSPPAAVTLVELDRSRRYELADLVDSCRTVPAHTTSPGTPQRVVRAEPEDWLLRIPTADYVKRLTGREPSRSGKVRCPFHEPDSTPSLHCYPDGTWFCFGCRAGGSIFDFGARVWRMGTRGRDFIELRARLVAEFGRGSS